MSNEELMALFSRTGSEDSFAEIVKRFEPQLLRFFKRFRQQDASAADLTQDTFLRVFRARETYQPGRPVAAWIFTIAQTRMHEHHRDETRLCRDNGRAISLDLAVENGLAKLSDIIPGDSGDHSETIANSFDLMALLGDLPDDEREVIDAVFFRGLSWRQAAHELGQPEGTVATRIRRALERLRDWLLHKAAA